MKCETPCTLKGQMLIPLWHIIGCDALRVAPTSEPSQVFPGETDTCKNRIHWTRDHVFGDKDCLAFRSCTSPNKAARD